MSPRITRSAARSAAEQSSPQDPPQGSAATPSASSTSQPASGPSRKRKAAKSVPSTDVSPEASAPSGPRRSKRPKVAAAEASARSPLQRVGNRAAKMSGTDQAASMLDVDSTSPDAQPSTRKRSSRGKKTHGDESASTSGGTSRRSKGSSKKLEDAEMRDDDTPLKNTGGRRSEHHAIGDDALAYTRAVQDDRDEDDDDEDDDNDDGEEFFRSAFFGASSRAELSRTVEALTGMMTVTGTGNKMRELLESLRAKDDPSRQLLALNNLSQFLLVSTEDNLSGNFAPDQFVKELVSLMQPNEFGEENSEIMLVACRCIANLMEALPPAIGSVVYGGAVPVLCQKLLEINYIDVAEQAISTLERISVEFPASIVREGGLTACLTYLDFFATSTQRTAVTTAANCCRNIPEDSFPVIRDVMPILLNVLNSSDQKVVEQGSLCVSRIADSFKFQPTKLEELLSPDLLKAILRLLLPGSTNLIGPNIHTQFLRVLSITARASPSLSAELFKMDVIDTLYQILTGVSPPEETDDVSSKIDGVVIMQALIHRPREQIYESLNVICELLPGIDSSGLDMDDTVATPSGIGDSILYPTASKFRAEIDAKRVELLAGCKDKVKRFATILLPTLTHAYSSTVNLGVRQKVLTAQLKMLSNLDIPILESALRTVPFSSYLASILSQHEHPSLTISAIFAATLLLQRMEHVYGYQFFREGVMSEVDKLADRPIPHRGSKDKGKDKSTGDVGQPPEDAHDDEKATHKEDRARLFREDISEDDGEDEDEMEDEVDEHEELDEDDEDEMEGENESQHDIHEDLSPSSSTSSERRGVEHEALRDHDDIVAMKAQQLRNTLRDGKCQESRNKALEILGNIKAVAENIREVYMHDAADGGVNPFKKLAGFFTGDALKSMTSAELLNSDIVSVFLDVFDDDKCPVSHTARAAFVEAFMDSNTSASAQGVEKSAPTPFSVLVGKLQDLLSRAEHFEVITVHQNSFSSGRSSATSMLAKQLRLKLVADEDSGIPKGFRNIMVSIHAIATFKALDDYLRPRLALTERPHGERYNNGLSSSLAALAAATGMANHQRFLERGLFGMAESPSAAAGNRSAAGVPVTPKQETSKSKREKRSGTSTSPSSRTPRAPEKSSSSLEVAGTTDVPPEPSTPAAQKTDDQPDTLECADERQLSDEEDQAEQNPLDTFVDDLEEDVADNDGADPSAVNMEVASTGKVTARKDDGTRIPTPAQGTGHRPPSRPRSQLSTPSNPAARAMSYAAAIQSTPPDWHIEFSMDGERIANNMTIYRAVHYNKDQPIDLSTRNVWSSVHPIKFKKVAGPPPASPTTVSAHKESTQLEKGELPPSLQAHTATAKILSLLGMLHQINANLEDMAEQLSDRVVIQPEPVSQFVNTKLTAKLNRQLEEPLIVASSCLPSWSEDLARLFPFLFPFETRHLFLQSTSFGYSRSMNRWQNSQSTNDSRRDRHRDERPFLGRLQRQKVRISRSRILESAIKVLELYGSSPSILEVEYFEEVGTGLGPTLEFYSTVSKEFSKRKSKLWRENESNAKDEYAFGKQGLFPAPMSPSQVTSENGKKVLHLFKMLGKFVARSMLDSRIIDISVNPMFFKLGSDAEKTQSSLGAVRAVDSGLASSLKLIKAFVASKKIVDSDDRLSTDEKAEAYKHISIRNVSVDDLGLDFTLPGYPAIELVDNGSNIPVTIDNVERYLDAVVDFTIGGGIQNQQDAFKTGFSEVFPYSALSSFTPDELVMLFGRIEEDWTLETLTDSIKADHGFNMDSKSVRNLLQTMSELSKAQRRDFLQFVTGSPKLPIGGFKSLTPMFTVVCKPSEPPYASDDYLPSVMTCVNYLKLPDYSDLTVMRSRLHTAIQEGQGAFHLS